MSPESTAVFNEMIDGMVDNTIPPLHAGIIPPELLANAIAVTLGNQIVVNSGLTDEEQFRVVCRLVGTAVVRLAQKEADR